MAGSARPTAGYMQYLLHAECDLHHYGECEEPYAFTTLEALLEDFQADVIRLTQE